MARLKRHFHQRQQILFVNYLPCGLSEFVEAGKHPVEAVDSEL